MPHGAGRRETVGSSDSGVNVFLRVPEACLGLGLAGKLQGTETVSVHGLGAGGAPAGFPEHSSGPDISKVSINICERGKE